MTVVWWCPKHGRVHDVKHESHSQMPYCVKCGRNVTPA